MAQDPEEHEELIDPSHDLDMVPLFTASPVEGEVEAEIVRSILEANDIPSIIIRAAGVPSIGFEVQVPRSRVSEATRLIAEQRAAGSAAADEAEAAQEEGL